MKNTEIKVTVPTKLSEVTGWLKKLLKPIDNVLDEAAEHIAQKIETEKNKQKGDK